MSKDQGDPQQYDKFDQPRQVCFGNGSTELALGQGQHTISTHQGSIHLDNTLHVPQLVTNLLSVSSLVEQGLSLHILGGTESIIISHEGETVGTASLRGGVYVLDTPRAHTATATAIESPAMQWHKKLGHTNFGTLAEMQRQGMIQGCTTTAPEFVRAGTQEHCNPCTAGKMHRVSHPPRQTRATAINDTLHSDVCGPMRIPTLKGARYILTLLDEASGFSMIVLLKLKSDVFHALLSLLKQFATQGGAPVKRLRTDNGGEYLGTELQQHLEGELGIWVENTSAYTPEQNGKAERLNRTLMERTRTFLQESNLPLSLWGHAVHHANNVRNSVIYGPTKQPPFLYFTGIDPDLTQLHPFGSTVHVHTPASKRHKLQAKSQAGRYLGTAGPLNSHNFFILTDNKITVSCDVRFQDKQPSLPAPTAPTVSPLVEVEQLEVEPAEDTNVGVSDLDPPAPPAIDPLHHVPAPQMPAPAPAGSSPFLPLLQGVHNGPQPSRSQPLPQPSQSLPSQAFPAPTTASTAPPDPQAASSSNPVYSNPLFQDLDLDLDLPEDPPPQQNQDLLDEVDESGMPPSTLELTAGGSETASEPDIDIVPEPAVPWQSTAGRRGATRRACGRYTANTATGGNRKKKVTFTPDVTVHPPVCTSSPDTSPDSTTPVYVANAARVVGFEPDPQTVAEALARPDGDEWARAIDSEMASLYERQTWEVVKMPAGARAVGCKFVLERKRDGRYKARLVAQGFSQREGIDYNETFAPVSTHATLRTFLATAAEQDLEVRQVDIKTAFLYGDLEEEVFMKHPPGYPGPPGMVCRLTHSLYGLKQANRQWHLKLKEELLAKGFVPSQADPALFLKIDSAGKVIAMVYVDDCLIAGRTVKDVQAVISLLSAVFETKDMGEPEDFLGIQIVRDRKRRTISIHQQPYIEKLLDDFDLTGAPPKNLPSSAFTEGLPLPPSLAPKYPSLVGSLLHLANCTRPDISHLVGCLSRHLKRPLTSHYKVALNLLHYLSGTKDLALVYGTAKGLEGFTDSDFAGDKETRRSTTGVAYLLHGAAITWQSKLQPTVSLSTTEAEYQAAGAGAREALWLRKLLPELGESVWGPIIIRGDNEAAISLTRNQMTTPRSKHIDIVHHFARERVASGEIAFIHVPSLKNVADILTKPLPRDLFLSHVAKLGLRKLS